MTKHKKILLLFMVLFLGCIRKDTFGATDNTNELEYTGENGKMVNHLTVNNNVRDIVNHPAFKGFG